MEEKTSGDRRFLLCPTSGVSHRHRLPTSDNLRRRLLRRPATCAAPATVVCISFVCSGDPSSAPSSHLFPSSTPATLLLLLFSFVSFVCSGDSSPAPSSPLFPSFFLFILVVEREKGKWEGSRIYEKA